jgi:hypothetical protein
MADSRGNAGQGDCCVARGPVPRLGGAVVVGQAEVVDEPGLPKLDEPELPKVDEDGGSDEEGGSDVEGGNGDAGAVAVGPLFGAGKVPSVEPGNVEPLVAVFAVGVVVLFIGQPPVDIGCVAVDDEAVVGTGVGIGWLPVGAPG